MAAPYQRYRKIFNLLKPQTAPPTAWDDVYSWLVNRARVTMIFLEVLVVVLFVGKLVVDIQGKAIRDAIKNADQRIVQNYSGIDQSARSTQQRSIAFKQLWEKSSQTAEVLAELYSYIPDTSTKVVVNYDNRVITITGENDRTLIASLEQSLKQSLNFTAVELFEIKSQGQDVDQDKGTFGIRAKLNDTIVRKL